jgi:pyruvate/2-oxoglutarate dehydrogenase complex dihydrolipoamide dehydrogenase (E3) component
MAASAPVGRYDLVAVGGGSAGLSLGIFGARAGARVAIVERDRLGGECTWTGCVPSKALLAAAHMLHAARRAPEFGLPELRPDGPVDLGRVLREVHALQHTIYQRADSPERLRALGCDVIEGSARFASPRELLVDGEPLDTRAVCVATGSRPLIPPIAGLDEIGYLTNESVFTELDELPARLLVVGGGPIGVELGQAFARLGSTVTIVTMEERLLVEEDAELSHILGEALAEEGVRVLTSCAVAAVERVEGDGRATLRPVGEGAEQTSAPPETLAFDALLLATGRRPNVDGLGLSAAGVALEGGAPRVDGRLRTSNPRVYAAGDVLGRHGFTHAAAYEASIVLRNAVFPGRARTSYEALPRATFTDPEIAHVGLTEEQARARHGDGVRVYRYPFAEMDRAIVERRTRGVVKLVTAGRGDRVVGAQIAGPAAGELIHEFALAMRQGVEAGELAQVVHVYPTLALGAQHAALGATERWLDGVAGSRWLRAYLGLSRWLSRPLLRHSSH